MRRGRGGPGGWWILLDVDVRLSPHDIVRPDVSGWRRERLADPRGLNAMTLMQAGSFDLLVRMFRASPADIKAYLGNAAPLRDDVGDDAVDADDAQQQRHGAGNAEDHQHERSLRHRLGVDLLHRDRKSTRLNSSHRT